MSSEGQIFKRDGQPIKFFLAAGPTYVTEKAGLRPRDVKELATKIKAYGGRLVQDIREAEVWIASDTALRTYKRYCGNDPDHRAEGASFVLKCIKRKAFQAERRKKRVPMRGCPPGRRSRFTAEEDELLCRWIAQEIPDVNTKGRNGESIHKLFVEMAEKEHCWALAKKHPWQSWKQRYKVHKYRLDIRIEEIVQEKRLMEEDENSIDNNGSDGKASDEGEFSLGSDSESEEDEETDDKGEFSLSRDSGSEEDEEMDDEGEFSLHEESESEEDMRMSKRRRIDGRFGNNRSPLGGRPPNARPPAYVRADKAGPSTQATLASSSQAAARSPRHASRPSPVKVDFDLTLDSDSDI